VEVDFTGFMDIVDMLGGIDIELSQKEADYLNSRGNWDVNPGSAGKWKLKAGMNHLTGEQALAYSRIRAVGNADFGRTDRQRKVLTILVNKCKDLNMIELNNLLQKVLPMITTDLSNSEILGYALEVFPLLSNLTIETMRIPANGAYKSQSIRGMSVLVPDLTKNRELLKTIMAEAEG
jgi:anionic cell wall polymer biosynthesis LytR-Cps2A-Psr (LCP) family protein